MKGATGFIPGKTLTEELSAAMERVKAQGVTYPEGYHRLLTRKYENEGVRYPHILMIIGEPRINHHFFYSRAINRNGRLLDYGCGTGDNVRQLIRDDFPREQITAFDINREVSTSVLTCTAIRIRSRTSLLLAQSSRLRKKSMTSSIPPPSSTLLPMKRNSRIILPMHILHSDPEESSSVLPSGWLKE